MIGNGPGRPLWVIARQDNGRMDVLTISHDENGEALPVFSFEEEAEMFLQLETPGTCWRASETTPDELVSLLCGPCAGVKSVALDPLPVVDGEIAANLTGRGRDRFVQNLMDAHKTRQNLVPEISDSTDSAELMSKDGAQDGTRDEEKERAEAVRRGILETASEAVDGEDGTPPPEYTVLNFDHSTSRNSSPKLNGTGGSTVPEEPPRPVLNDWS